MRGAHGIETVYQDLAVAPRSISWRTFSWAARLSGRVSWASVFHMLDKKRMLADTVRYMSDLKIGIRSMDQKVGTLSGGQRQGVAVARSRGLCPSRRDHGRTDRRAGRQGIAHGGRIDPPGARTGLPVILISHNMPQVFELADRIHIQRLGRRVAVVRPADYSMSDVVAIMTGAMDAKVALQCLNLDSFDSLDARVDWPAPADSPPAPVRVSP